MEEFVALIETENAEAILEFAKQHPEDVSQDVLAVVVKDLSAAGKISAEQVSESGLFANPLASRAVVPIVVWLDNATILTRLIEAIDTLAASDEDVAAALRDTVMIHAVSGVGSEQSLAILLLHYGAQAFPWNRVNLQSVVPERLAQVIDHASFSTNCSISPIVVCMTHADGIKLAEALFAAGKLTPELARSALRFLQLYGMSKDTTTPALVKTIMLLQRVIKEKGQGEVILSASGETTVQVGQVLVVPVGMTGEVVEGKSKFRFLQCGESAKLASSYFTKLSGDNYGSWTLLPEGKLLNNTDGPVQVRGRLSGGT